MITSFQRLFRFGVVGVCAMGVHWLLAIALIELLHVTPLIANAAGFVVAFQCSYWGHRILTFAAHELPHRQTLPRFLAVALWGLACNLAINAGLLTLFPEHYRLDLVISLIAVAAMTFLLSQRWAFLRQAS